MIINYGKSATIQIFMKVFDFKIIKRVSFFIYA